MLTSSLTNSQISSILVRKTNWGTPKKKFIVYKHKRYTTIIYNFFYTSIFIQQKLDKIFNCNDSDNTFDFYFMITDFKTVFTSINSKTFYLLEFFNYVFWQKVQVTPVKDENNHVYLFLHCWFFDRARSFCSYCLNQFTYVKHYCVTW